MRKVSVEDILDTERRQEDCLLAATGWIREKIPGMLRKHSFPGSQTGGGRKQEHAQSIETYIPTHTHTQDPDAQLSKSIKIIRTSI